MPCVVLASLLLKMTTVGQERALLQAALDLAANALAQNQQNVAAQAAVTQASQALGNFNAVNAGRGDGDAALQGAVGAARPPKEAAPTKAGPAKAPPPAGNGGGGTQGGATVTGGRGGR